MEFVPCLILFLADGFKLKLLSLSGRMVCFQCDGISSLDLVCFLSGGGSWLK